MLNNLKWTDPTVPGLDELPEVHFEFLFMLIGKSTKGFSTGQSLLVLKSWYTGGAPQNEDFGADSQTDLNNQILFLSVVQAKLLDCCYGFMSEFVTSADIILLFLYEKNS